MLKIKGTAKFRQIVNTATDLFMKYGYRRVTVEEICRTAHVSKMTFYKFFSNKIELMKYILNAMTEHYIGIYRSIMDSDMPFSEKAEKLIQLKLEQGEVYGRELFVDLVQNPIPEIRKFLTDMQQQHIARIMQDFSTAQQQGHIRKDVKPEFILYIVNQLSEMVKDEALLKMYGSLKELTGEIMNFFFYGILGHKQE